MSFSCFNIFSSVIVSNNYCCFDSVLGFIETSVLEVVMLKYSSENKRRSSLEQSVHWSPSTVQWYSPWLLPGPAGCQLGEMSRKVLTLQSLNQQAGPVGRWDSDLAPHTTAVDTEHSPGHWRTLPPLHKWDTLLPQQNNIKLYGSTRVYWHSLSIYLSFLGGESDSSVTNDKVDNFRSNWIGSLVSILIYFPNESKWA